MSANPNLCCWPKAKPACEYTLLLLTTCDQDSATAVLQMCSREEGYAALECIKQKLLDKDVPEEAAEQSLSTEVSVERHFSIPIVVPNGAMHLLLAHSRRHVAKLCRSWCGSIMRGNVWQCG